MEKSEKKNQFPAVFGESCIGMVRRNNEDSYVYCPDPHRRALLVVVADGVGGNGHGDLASRTICCELLRAFRSAGSGAAGDPERAGAWLLTEVERVNDRLLKLNEWMNSPRNMSSTVAAALFLPGHGFVVWAGDSRLYAGSPGNIWQSLTTDHTLTEELLRRGDPKAETVPRNLITRSIGSRTPSKAELRHFTTTPGERFLICSDGIARSMSAEKLAGFMLSAATPRRAIQSIMRAALLAGGLDNLTGVAVFLPKEE